MVLGLCLLLLSSWMKSDQLFREYAIALVFILTAVHADGDFSIIFLGNM